MERRRHHRTPLSVPVKIRSQDGIAPEQTAVTRDLSSSGIFLYSETALKPGSKLELVIMLPPGLGLGPGGWALCQASVLRLEEVPAAESENQKSNPTRVGVAATLDRIDLLPELL
jgi:hypothetical protein